MPPREPNVDPHVPPQQRNVLEVVRLCTGRESTRREGSSRGSYVTFRLTPSDSMLRTTNRGVSHPGELVIPGIWQDEKPAGDSRPVFLYLKALRLSNWTRFYGLRQLWAGTEASFAAMSLKA